MNTTHPPMSDTTGKDRKTRTRKWGLAALATILAVGVSLTAVTSAAAEVNPNDSANQEPNYQPTGAATAVYSLRLIQINARALVTVNGNSMNDGGVVDTWEPYNASYGNGSILQPNQLWEFVPAADNTGHTITSGYGWLRSRQSGLCLEVNGASTSDNAAVDQWDCLPGHDNEMWTSVPGPAGNPTLKVRHSGALLAINDPNCQSLGAGSDHPSGDGQTLLARTDPGYCGIFTITKANYAYASNQMTVPIWSHTVDGATYGCINGWAMAKKGSSVSTSTSNGGPNVSVLLPGSGFSDNLWFYYENLSTGTTAPVADEYNRLAYTHDDWFSSNPINQTGQIRLFCYTS